nr:MAG TPA: hypothetical protein [Caudoviricetes sp.]
MKFKKDGKVYESFEDAVNVFSLGDRKIFANGEKTEFKFPDDMRQSMIWAYEDADMGRVRLNAKLMGYVWFWFLSGCSFLRTCPT